MDHLFPYPKMGSSWLEILEDPLTRKLLGHDASMAEKTSFSSGVTSRLNFLLQDPLKHISFAKIGYTALEAFLQANCTGPPLDFDSVPVVIPDTHKDETPQIIEEMVSSLSVDGIDVYALTPRIELFWLAKTVMGCKKAAEEGFNGRRARFRVNFWHQKLLPEISDTLRTTIYRDAEVLEAQITSRLAYGGAAAEEHMVEFLVERANVRIYYGDEVKAREDLSWAAKIRDFEFVLTGRLGRRTVFQEKETSQLLVLAKSRDFEPEPYSSRKSSRADNSSRKSSVAERSIRGSVSIRPMTPASPGVLFNEADLAMALKPEILSISPRLKAIQPDNLPLNDDTLLEKPEYSVADPDPEDPATSIIDDDELLPLRLRFMDASDQPLLFPMDSIILLRVASSITNTQPTDGLTREQALPYVSRVLEGGSSNWQVYTDALLVRSRIEGYQSRTAERGLLQLQALVDQVIAETNGSEVTARTDGQADGDTTSVSTFLPKPKDGESAGVAERMRFIHQVHPPFKWELEGELAARWTQMGGLRTALEIYRRLEMHPEVALCLAATDQEAEAIKLLKELLFENPAQEMKDGETVQMRKPLPTEAARMLCILGDIEGQPKYYNLAWEVSSNHYARAQRSLGVFYLKKNDRVAAVNAYKAALRITRLDVATWFSLGCVQLEMKEFQSAVESFSRVVQLEDRDAEGWSNLAVALLRLPPPKSPPGKTDAQPDLTSSPTAQSTGVPIGRERSISNPEVTSPARRRSSQAVVDPLQHTREALRALRRAANLKRNDPRIWDNYLTVAASIPPNEARPERGTPWQEVIQAMSRVITLRGPKEGERCIDIKILGALIDYITEIWEYPDPSEGEVEEEATDESGTAAVSHVNLDISESPGTATPTNEPSPTTVISPSEEKFPDDAEEEGSYLEQTATITPITTTRPIASRDARQPQAPTKKKLPFIPRALLTLIDKQIAPLTTNNASLYSLLAEVALWRHRPAESLGLIEKAWRASTSTDTSAAGAGAAAENPYDSQEGWDVIVESTLDLVDAYKELGPRERERTGGEVGKTWQFKSRSALRGVMGRGKDAWEGSEGWKKLEEAMEELK